MDANPELEKIMSEVVDDVYSLDQHERVVFNYLVTSMREALSIVPPTAPNNMDVGGLALSFVSLQRALDTVPKLTIPDSAVMN